MERRTFSPRENWQAKCEKEGLNFHTIGGEEYWQETAGYRFTLAQIESIEAATQELHDMCMDLVRDVVQKGDYDAFGLPNWAPSLIECSWKAKHFHLYGRFDLMYNGREIKLLEYNADTPTALLEAAVIQWTWVQDQGLPDQFNSIHDKLVARWRKARVDTGLSHVHLVAMEEAGLEDWGTVNYLTETAIQAGINASLVSLETLGWDSQNKLFTDAKDDLIMGCFKLYPWEWMLQDEFGKNVAYSLTRFIEPVWKMLLSNKAILALLWQRHQGHPLLLPAYLEGEDKTSTASGRWIRKPLLAREGANASLVVDGTIESLSGSDFNPAYDDSYIRQQWCQSPEFDGWHPVIGSWVIGDEAAGMGIREDKALVTGDLSRFVPHYFEE